MANLARQQGNLPQATTYYSQARDIFQAINHPFNATESLYGLGLVTLAEGQAFDQAKIYFEEALSLAQTANNHEISTQIYLSRADLQERLGHLAAAREENRLAVRTVESLRANIALPEARIRLQGSRIAAYEQMVRRLSQDRAGYAEAFQYVEMAKSRALIEMLAGRNLRPPQSMPAVWLDKAADLHQQLRYLYEDPSAAPDQVMALENELAYLRHQMRQHDAEFESFQTARPLTLNQVMPRLPEQSVLLEYFIADETILAFVVTATTFSLTQLPLSPQQLARAFSQTETGQQLRHVLPGPDGQLRSPWLLGQLRAALLEPLGEAIWQAPLLCIVPHGLLHYVPFHALYRETADGPQYLIDDEGGARRLVYAPSATTLLDYCQRKPSSSFKGCLTLGYNGDLLTEAEPEAHHLAQFLNGQSYTGIAATRAALLKEGRQARYLHLACHGTFNPIWPMASSLTLADGPLDIADVLQNLHLNAELVTLSACETGRSHIIMQGDELIGLTQAFLYAGTPAVLVSHWAVDDLSTRLLMTHFYQTLTTLSRDSVIAIKAEALAQAQRYLRSLTWAELRQTLASWQTTEIDLQPQLFRLAEAAGYSNLADVPPEACLLAHPYYWAAFFLVGERLGMNIK